MFRKINLKDENEDFKVELYKNRHEKIADIPNDYIGIVKRTVEDIDEFEINIPRFNQIKDKKNINPIYLKIKPMQHIIVTTTVDGVEKKERFVLVSPKGTRNKNSGEKSFKAMSFESTLKKKRTSFEGKVIQLKKDNIHIAEGILDKFARETGWRIDYVDPKSRTELMSTTEKINVDLFNNYNKAMSVSEGGLLFEKDIITTIADNRPLYISFEYNNFKTYDNGKLLIETPAIYNTITDALYTNIKKVQAYHYSDVGNRYGIRYVFTLTDNTIVERISVFTNIINKTFTCENIRLTWETGNIVETENVKYINIESLDTDWYEALRSLQDNFKSVFLFDSYNKTVSVIHRDNLGEEKPYILTYDNAIIDIEVTENSDYITGLKVIGKDGLSIVSENIYGDDIVRNYSEYIRLGNMSEELQLALQRYEAILITKQQEWLAIKNNVITETQKQVRIDSEIQSLQSRIKDLKNILAGYMSAKDSVNQARIKGEIDTLETRLNQCLALRIGYRNNIELLNDELMTISKSIDRNVVVDINGKIFTDRDLQELNDIEQFGAYEDDYYTNSFSLLNASKKVLEDMIKPQLDFDINCINLCKSIQNKRGWKYILQLGSLFKFDESELVKELGEDTVRLVGYDYEPKTNTISNLVFTNKTHKYDIGRKLADLGKKTNTTNNILNSLRPIIDDAMLSNNFVGEVLKNGLDMSAYVARSRGISNFLEISEAGIFISDQSDMNKSLYVGSGLMAITQDGWNSSETAISSDGILAKLLVGSVILGEKLIITSTDGSFYIGNMSEKQGFGLSIKDSSLQQRIFLGTELDADGIRRAKLRLTSANGKDTVLDENGVINRFYYQYSENLDGSNPIEIPIDFDAGVGSIKSFNITVKPSAFRSYSRGVSGGGSIVTSGGSGSYTGTSSTTDGGSYYNYTTTGTANWSGAGSGVNLPTSYAHPVGSEHYHYYSTDTLNHDHFFSVSIPNHFHNFTVSFGTHTHEMNTTHTHEMEHGIYKSTIASYIYIKVNGQTIRQGINSTTTIDIASYLNPQSSNVIIIGSSSLGRVDVNVSARIFSMFA